MRFAMQSEDRKVGVSGVQLETIRADADDVILMEIRADGSVVAAEMDARAETYPDRLITLQLVRHAYRVLPVGHEKALFERAASNAIAPHRQPAFQKKLIGRQRLLVFTGELGRTGEDYIPAFGANAFGDGIQHHCAAQRVLQRGDEEAVIAASETAGNGTGGVAAEAIRYQPFFIQMRIAGRRTESAFAQSAYGKVHSSSV